MAPTFSKYHIVGYLTTAAFLASVVGCAGPRPDPTPIIDAPESYARQGVQFSYPSNWTLKEKTDTEDGEPVRDISVGARGTAGVLLKVFENPPEQVQLDKFILDFSETLKAKVPDLVTLTEVTQKEVEATVAGDKRRGVRKKFLFELFFKRFAVSVDFHRVDGEKRSAFFVAVNADNNEAMLPGIELIRNTLKLY